MATWSFTYIFLAIIYLSFQLYTIKNNAGLTFSAFDLFDQTSVCFLQVDS